MTRLTRCGAMRVGLALAVALGVGPLNAAPGAWSADVPGPRVAAPGRWYQTGPLSVPGHLRDDGAVVTRVGWSFDLPSGRRVRAQLCSGGQCIYLPRQRGSSTALEGLAAAGSFHFRFALPAGERRALGVRELQLRVGFRDGGGAIAGKGAPESPFSTHAPGATTE